MEAEVNMLRCLEVEVAAAEAAATVGEAAAMVTAVSAEHQGA